MKTIYQILLEMKMKKIKINIKEKNESTVTNFFF